MAAYLDKTGLTYLWSKIKTALAGKQDKLTSGENIKTVNNQSILGSGNITITGGGDTSSCVHKTGDETVGGEKTFTDGIAVPDASHILYSGSGGGGGQEQGFTRGSKTTTVVFDGSTVIFDGFSEEPKAFYIRRVIDTNDSIGSGVASVISVVGDSEILTGVHTTGSQHNYSSAYTKQYNDGSLRVTAPSGVSFSAGTYEIVYFTGNGTLTFRQTSYQPGSGVTSNNFSNLAGRPNVFALQLESQVNSESYHRVASIVGYDDDGFSYNAFTFYSQNVYNLTNNFTVSYNNGSLAINSGGANSGGYFHNPGTYRLYYLTEEDIGSGGGEPEQTYESLGEELEAIHDAIDGVETLLAAI